MSALQTGGQIVVKPTKTQSGGFLGTLLASIGVPLLLNALTGKGLQVDTSRPRRSVDVYVPKMPRIQKIQNQSTSTNGGLVLPMNYRSPPFIGTWGNQIGLGGVKPKKKAKKKGFRQGTFTRKKQSIQQYPINRSNSISFIYPEDRDNSLISRSTRFINKPLINIDLLNWVKKLGIKHFRGIYSRDALPPKMLKNEVGIINLDSQIGPGTHWVAYRNGDKHAEYFDSFGLIMPNEVMNYLGTSGKKYFIPEMRYKKEIPCCVDIGTYTIYWRDKEMSLC